MRRGSITRLKGAFYIPLSDHPAQNTAARSTAFTTMSENMSTLGAALALDHDANVSTCTALTISSPVPRQLLRTHISTTLPAITAEISIAREHGDVVSVYTPFLDPKP